MVCLGILLGLSGIFVPLMQVCACGDTQKSCLTNTKQLGLNLLMYAGDWNDKLPPKDVWMNVLESYSKKPLNLRDPGIRQTHAYGYAFNSDLSAILMTTIDEVAWTPMVYDSSNLLKNASDPVLSLPNPGRHWGRNNMAYTDSHVRSLP
jgi:hypothetical protein